MTLTNTEKNAIKAKAVAYLEKSIYTLRRGPKKL